MQDGRGQARARRVARERVGEFLVERPVLVEPYIDVTRPCLDDVKQDACLRALVALRRAGKPIDEDDVIASFNAEPRLVATCYRRAYVDHLRAMYGRNTPHKQTRYQVFAATPNGFLEVADRRAGEEFDRALDHVAASMRLMEIWLNGWEHVPARSMQRLVRTLLRIVRLKRDGLTRVPPDLRKRVHAMRIVLGRWIEIRDL